MGLLGSCLVAADGMVPAAVDSVSSVSVMSSELVLPDEELKGILLLLSSCFFYSLAVIRLGEYGKARDKLMLCTMKYNRIITDVIQ